MTLASTADITYNKGPFFSVYCCISKLWTCDQVCRWVWLLPGPWEASCQVTRWAHAWAGLASDLSQEQLEKNHGDASGTQMDDASCQVPRWVGMSSAHSWVGLESGHRAALGSEGILILLCLPPGDQKCISSILSWLEQHCAQIMTEKAWSCLQGHYRICYLTEVRRPALQAMDDRCGFDPVPGQQDHFQTLTAKGQFQDMRSAKIGLACFRGMGVPLSFAPGRAGLLWPWLRRARAQPQDTLGHTAEIEVNGLVIWGTGAWHVPGHLVDSVGKTKVEQVVAESIRDRAVLGFKTGPPGQWACCLDVGLPSQNNLL